MGKNRKFGLLLAAVCILTLALVGTGQAGTFVLTGNWISAGVSNSGGLIDDGFVTGIQFDPTGTGSFPQVPDYIMPGTPLEFFSLNVAGTDYGAAGYVYGNTYGMTSFNTSGGTVQSSYSQNLGSGAVLTLLQTMWFDAATDKAIHFIVEFANTGTSTATDIYYGRGLDPDQDVYAGGGYSTNNTQTATTATAVGPLTLLYITVADKGGTPGLAPGVASVDSFWTTDAYALYNTPRSDGNGDNTINLAWYIGSLDPGQSKQIHFDYELGKVPVPPSVLLLGSGLLGLLGFGYRRRQQD